MEFRELEYCINAELSEEEKCWLAEHHNASASLQQLSRLHPEKVEFRKLECCVYAELSEEEKCWLAEHHNASASLQQLSRFHPEKVEFRELRVLRLCRTK